MDFKKIIEDTIVPINFPVEEKKACYDAVDKYVNSILPNKLYRFRACSERNLSAFYNDELWFSNGDKTERIVADFIADNNTSIMLFESGKDKYVLFKKAQTTQNDEMEAKIYGVSSEKPVELFSQSRMNISVEKGELYTYDYTYFVLEPGSKDWMSQSEQKYHLKWDNENKKCSDYKANVMSEKEFNKISNSKDVKKNIEDALKKEYSDGIKNVKYTYLTREDSTLDINTVVTDSEGTKYKNYVTVLHKDDKLGKDVVIQEGNKKVSILEE